MKKKLKIIDKIFIVAILVFLIIIISNNLHLRSNSKKIVPNGILTEVNGHNLHIYYEGENENKPTLVFLAGRGTPAPVYDFKKLYSLFSDDYTISVIEKIGYGYADIKDTDRDIDIVLEESRTALQSVGLNGPYVLFSHSMSGLEALYWLSKYPEEIIAIIGLDMAVPEFFNELKKMERIVNFQMGLTRIVSKFGFQRFYYPHKLDKNTLTAHEYKQYKYLLHRNLMNVTIYKNEPQSLFANAEKVQISNYLNETGNMLLFSSNGKGLSDSWISYKKDFAEIMESELVILDCGHYIHHFESEKIAEKSKLFLNELLKQKEESDLLEIEND